ncbi:DNA adenine methylase [Listeria cornellensis]|uniref:site-specific DNA-methyltransferase (adenine-specific) n=1 Tax=Listeria cornellensis FSL F6-0969 TaxID=1265820 RepID=W7BJV0_9LIST|nr:DNA adenine methylase [Listeria cornellensis]EUJ27349.1 D12 class N6 adenine-specific DNA methyltransferase family protein [Listeria cornellensis FSL F6-0969]
MSVKPILNYPGSKRKMAKLLANKMPGHSTYLEPFAGSLAMLFEKEKSIKETVNDLDGRVVNLFRVIRNHPEELKRLLQYTPFSREEYQNSYVVNDDPIEDARLFLVRCWMAIGAKTSDITGWRSCIAPNSPDTPRQWNSLHDRIDPIVERLKDVQIENQDALKLIERYNRPYVFIYADPPYPLSTRSNRMYANEMTDDDHMALLEKLKEHTGPVWLSSYENDLYNQELPNWEKRHYIMTAEAGASRTETLYINPAGAKEIDKLPVLRGENDQLDLFKDVRT